jgi:hypothetical protein
MQMCKRPPPGSTLRPRTAQRRPLQVDRTEVRDLNPPISIKKDMARFQASVQQSEAVRKPKAEGNPCNCVRFHRRSPSGRRIREHFRQRTAYHNRRAISNRRGAVDSANPIGLTINGRNKLARFAISLSI